MKSNYRESRYTRNIVNGVRFWLIMVVLVSSIGPILVSADVVWEDNFDDGNYDGWTIETGEFSADDFYLENTELGEAEGWDVSIIGYEITVNTGTWSFDCYTPSEYLEGIYIGLLSDASKVGYLFVEISFDRVALWRSTRLVSWYSTFNETWTHIDVTVDENSTVDVFIDGTHRIHYNTTVPIMSEDNRYFFFNSWTIGQAIDNIVVSDAIDYESLPFNTTSITTTTTSAPSPDGELDMTMVLLLGGGVAAIVVIVLIVWKVRKG